MLANVQLMSAQLAYWLFAANQHTQQSKSHKWRVCAHCFQPTRAEATWTLCTCWRELMDFSLVLAICFNPAFVKPISRAWNKLQSKAGATSCCAIFGQLKCDGLCNFHYRSSIPVSLLRGCWSAVSDQQENVHFSPNFPRVLLHCNFQPQWSSKSHGRGRNASFMLQVMQISRKCSPSKSELR